MKIKFIEVGRNKMTWESECPANSVEELEYDWLYSHVKQKVFVMSNDLEFWLNDDMTSGSITAGFRMIGEFQILKGE